MDSGSRAQWQTAANGEVIICSKDGLPDEESTEQDLWHLIAQTDQEVYLEQSELFLSGKYDLVCKVKRSLYGLNQSGHIWFQCLSALLENLGFNISVHDSGLWTVKRGKCICFIWVDDLVYGSTDKIFTGWVETEWGKKFTNGDCDGPTWFLPISFELSADRMFLRHQ